MLSVLDAVTSSCEPAGMENMADQYVAQVSGKAMLAFPFPKSSSKVGAIRARRLTASRVVASVDPAVVPLATWQGR